MEAITAAITAYADHRAKEDRASLLADFVTSLDRYKRELAAKDAEIAALRKEHEARLATAITASRVYTDADTASTDSGYNEIGEPGTDQATLDFIFNTLRPFLYSHVWKMFRNNYNRDPTQFLVFKEGHYGSGDTLPHLTICQKFPEIGQGGRLAGREATVTVHVYYRPATDTRLTFHTPKRFYTHVTMVIDRTSVTIAKFPGC
jgi:hypothetical protein